MGKRQIGELQPSEFVVAILISELAAIPMQDNGIPLINGIIPIVTLLSLEVILSYVMLKSCWAREFLTGKPSMIIKEGVINKKEMERLRFNMDDLVKELRLQGILNIKNVQFAVIETNGKLSIVTVADQRGVKLSDLSIKGEEEKMQFVLISGGKLEKDNLKQINKSQKWIDEQLKKENLNSYKEVLYMSADSDGNTVIIKEEKSS
jgi:uncharacterized membrane protein YcaP (DUF421 family)